MYEVEDTTSGQRYALKSALRELVPKQGLDDPLQRELSLHYCTHAHPHIITLFDALMDDDGCHVVMER